MNDTVVDRLYQEFESIISHLDREGEISFRNTADENFRKALLLAAASYFEYRVRETLEEFAKESSNGNERLVEFIKNKAISRQYHTFFNWDSSNANSFFGLFGSLFKDLMQSRVENDDQLERAIKAFLEIGRERNRLVHQDFGTFPIEKTAQEIYELYQTAIIFIDTLSTQLRTRRP